MNMNMTKIKKNRRKSFYYSQKHRCGVGNYPKNLPSIPEETRFITKFNVDNNVFNTVWKYKKGGCSATVYLK